MKASRFISLLSSALIPLACLAHVGSPDVFLQGNAGPYHLVVTVRTPPMIPGIAAVEIRSETPGVREVRIVPLMLVGPGSKNPPPPDRADASPQDPQFFTGKLWLMESGSWQLRIEVDGAPGKGEIAVPVPAFARSSRPMQKELGIALFLAMLFLVLAAASIMAAARRDAQLAPGTEPASADVRGGRRALIGTVVVIAGVLFLGNRWWNAKANEWKQRKLYKPPTMTASFEGHHRLSLEMRDSEWHYVRPESVMTKLIPDHGHLMHLFLVRVPAMDRFYHLHPSLIGEAVEPDKPLSEEIRRVALLPRENFATNLPSVAGGRYQLFADIVRASGFPDTMVAELDLPDVSGQPLTGDDSEAAAAPIRENSSSDRISVLADGSRMVWLRDSPPLRANQLLWFRFRVEDADGKPVHDLEPYMGMAGHAEFLSWDRSVFAHIHPDGSVPMAALTIAEKASGAATKGGMHGMQMSAIPPVVSFPYGFPKTSAYRIFVQVKRKGQVLTGVFDAHTSE